MERDGGHLLQLASACFSLLQLACFSLLQLASACFSLLQLASFHFILLHFPLPSLVHLRVFLPRPSDPHPSPRPPPCPPQVLVPGAREEHAAGPPLAAVYSVMIVSHLRVARRA
eukprot:992979-Prorocentrum_minimum.AAC.1